MMPNSPSDMINSCWGGEDERNSMALFFFSAPDFDICLLRSG